MTSCLAGILNVALSNNGKDWSASAILEYLNEPGKQFSYPSVIQTEDGLVHIVYTWHRDRIKHVVLDPSKLAEQAIIEGKWPQEGKLSLKAFKKIDSITLLFKNLFHEIIHGFDRRVEPRLIQNKRVRCFFKIDHL